MTKKENGLALLFILPSLAGVAIFFAVPFVMSLGYAATGVDGSFAGLDNFTRLFGSGAFRLAAVNTLRFMAVAIPLNIAIPLLIACMLFNLSGGGWLKTVFMSPLVIPSACVAFFFQSLFMQSGLLSRILGVNTDWLQTEHSFAIAVGIYVWKNMGFNLVMALAGLANIPKDYYEWADVEGMGKTRMFFGITLVYMVPALFIMFVMSFINSFKIYRELYMLAGNYPHENIYMLQHYMNNQFARLHYQNLTTAAFVTTFIITVFMAVFFIIDKKSEFGE
jgi:multiple sugar transport system permease protein